MQKLIIGTLFGIYLLICLLPWSALMGLGAILGILLIYTLDWKHHFLLFRLFSAVLVLLIILQGIGRFTTSLPWSVCFERTIEIQQLTTPCERSAQFPRGEKTFEVSSIHWTDNTIPLYFMNDKIAFNYYLPTDPDREHLPYRMTLKGKVQGKTVRIQSSFSGLTALIGNTSYPISPHIPLVIPLEKQTLHEVVVQGTHTRDISDELDITVHHPHLSVTERLYSIALFTAYALFTICIFLGFYQALRREDPSTQYWVIAITTLLTISYFIPKEYGAVLLLAGFFAVTRYKQQLLVPIGILILLITLSFFRPLIPYVHVFVPYAIPFITILTLITWVFLKKPHAWKWITLLLILNSFVLISHTHPYGELVLFTGGNDELTHIGHARSILLGTTWHEKLAGGEQGLFYYQPLYRYLLAGIQALWGESIFGPYVIQTILMSMAYVATIRFVRRFSIRYLVPLFTICIALTSFLFYLSLFQLSQSGFQQAIATPLLIIGITGTLSLLYSKTEKLHIPLLGLLWGITIALRTDYLPLLPLIFGVVAYVLWKKVDSRQRVRQGFLFILLLIIAPLLVMVRNYIIGGSFVLIPTSGIVNLAPEFVRFFSTLTHTQGLSVGYVSMVTTILTGYHSDIIGLIRDVAHNIQREFIGTIPPRVILWYAAPIYIGYSLFSTSKKTRIVVLLILVFLLTLLLPSVFFDQHNGIAMFGVYDYFLLVFLAIAGSRIFAILRI